MTTFRANAPIYHCPFCAEEDLRPVEEGWHCRACARLFAVTLVRVVEEGIPGRVDQTRERAR
jgi:ribosomal protein L37AE/L43A